MQKNRSIVPTAKCHFWSVPNSDATSTVSINAMWYKSMVLSIALRPLVKATTVRICVDRPISMGINQRKWYSMRPQPTRRQQHQIPMPSIIIDHKRCRPRRWRQVKVESRTANGVRIVWAAVVIHEPSHRNQDVATTTMAMTMKKTVRWSTTIHKIRSGLMVMEALGDVHCRPVHWNVLTYFRWTRSAWTMNRCEHRRHQ